MERVIKILTDIYTNPDPKGRQKLLRKDVERLRRIRVEDIQFIEHSLASNGKISKKHCIIKMFDEYQKINHTFEETKNWLTNTEYINNSLGFKYGTRKNKS